MSEHAAHQPGEWIYFPDYTQSNPYQHLVYQNFPSNWHTRPGTPDHALAMLRSVAGRPVVFHLHWEDACYREAPSLTEANQIADTLIQQIDDIRALGGTVIWTVHNEAPHEPRFPGFDAQLRARLARHVDIVHMHSPIAAETMAPALGIDPASVLLTKLGGFAGFYPDDVSREAARRYFELDDTTPVFAMIGAMRPYKGLDLALAAFDRVRAAIPNAHLILAGRMNAPDSTRFIRHNPNTTILARQIDDCVVQYVMRAADWAVFAFRKIMVSSSILLPLGFDIPVIAPDLPTIAEMVTPHQCGLLYEANNPDALAASMITAATMPHQQRAIMSAGGHNELATRTYDQYANTLITAVEHVEYGSPSCPRPRHQHAPN